MAQGGTEVSAHAVEAMARLVEVISRPATRKSFVADPVRALEKAGVKVDDLPRGVLDGLAELSHEELELVSRLNAALVESGLRAVGSKGGTVAIL